VVTTKAQSLSKKLMTRNMKAYPLPIPFDSQREKLAARHEHKYGYNRDLASRQPLTALAHKNNLYRTPDEA
jgi:hypothetical protein